MGLFLDVGVIVGRRGGDVASVLTSYAADCGGSMEPLPDGGQFGGWLGLTEYGSGTEVTFPDRVFDAGDATRFVSERLGCAALALSVFDGDFWSYTLFDAGTARHGFVAIPDYFGDHVMEERWTAGDAAELAARVPSATVESVERYLEPWTGERRGTKAYPDDQFVVGDVWQFTDFLSSIGFGWPIDDTGAFDGDAYRFAVERSYYTD